MAGICKSYPGVRALSNVDFDLMPGEIHALVGENGAGKSTLIKILTGVEKLDSGRITLEGKDILPKSTQDAQKLGIGTVYQEINLCPNLTVAENIFIGKEKTKHGKIDWKSLYADARRTMK
ncbi:MAG TPA: sugar ABC transporter ATP-binding protein, partial [Ruminococcaceae bacterium]|nr:sugar ABC transporter ATP-binding protein [Oscillospiraceae bacterium]